KTVTTISQTQVSPNSLGMYSLRSSCTSLSRSFSSSSRSLANASFSYWYVIRRSGSSFLAFSSSSWATPATASADGLRISVFAFSSNLLIVESSVMVPHIALRDNRPKPEVLHGSTPRSIFVVSYFRQRKTRHSPVTLPHRFEQCAVKCTDLPDT